MKKLLLLLVPFALTSCVSMQSQNMVGIDGRIKYDAVIDMSGMITAMNSFSGMSDTTSDTKIDKNLCTDFNKETASFSAYYENMSCQSTGDYAARVKSELPALKNPGILVQSGVIVLNPFWMNGKSASDSSASDMDASKLGIVLRGVFDFPYPVVYREAGTLVDADTLMIDMLDKRVIGRRDLYIIARADGKKPTLREVAQYKRLLRLQINKAKRSGLYDNFTDFLGSK